MSAAGYLLLRRDGGLFGVASAVVRGLSRRGSAYRVEMPGTPGIPETTERGLFADEVVGVIDKLDVRPLGRLARRYWPEPADGWAIHAGAPVVVIDPLRPPGVFLARQTERTEGEVSDGE